MQPFKICGIEVTDAQQIVEMETINRNSPVVYIEVLGQFSSADIFFTVDGT